MLLQSRSPYLSIGQFTSVEVPDFVVLTGVNGSGKSHLLEAIEKKHVLLGGINHENIILFNYETFRMDNESICNMNQLNLDYDEVWNTYMVNIQMNISGWHSTIEGDYETLKNLCSKEKCSFMNLNSDHLDNYKKNINFFFNETAFKNNPFAESIYSIINEIPYSIYELHRNEFIKLFKPHVLKNKFLPSQLSKTIWAYYAKYRENRQNAFENKEYGANHEVLSDEEFLNKNGPKPWDLINGILHNFDTLNYKITSPEGLSLSVNYQAKLKHIENEKIEVEFSMLSSGERVLLALVASIYKTLSDNSFPDILLLDEIDASLHPSMIRKMLEVINDIFLSRGTKVFLVTHSPTTIAFAPENSIYVVNRSGMNRVEKKSKQDALSILTQGYATLEEGLKLFDEVAKSNTTIITEGNNSSLIARALKLHGIDDVTVLTGVEKISGKNQLGTLFDFFSKVDHRNKVIFIFDCDVLSSRQSIGNTFIFVLPKNAGNPLVKSGIENIFPVHLFDNFQKIIKRTGKAEIIEFDESSKRDLEQHILERNNKDDFCNFSSMIDEIQRIQRI